MEKHEAGGEYIGFCPFNDDQNPSLSVNAGKGVLYCFGYDRSGNHQSFLKERRTQGKRDYGLALRHGVQSGMG